MNTRGPLTLAACLALSISIVAGLECFGCVYLNVQPPDRNVSDTLSPILVSSQEACKGSVNRDSPGVTTENCSASQAGSDSICGKVEGTVYISLPSGNGTVDIVYRGCFGKLSNDGCKDAEDYYTDAVQFLFRENKVSGIAGTGCACSGELCNGQQKVAAETLGWLAGLLLALCAHQLW